jgi:PAS domain S-box-containing protein/putative nucleotidyltransferase with HDIG domain
MISGEQMKILIVDDNADDRKLLRLNLERHGCETVIEACNGREGFELAERHHPDLIITDALMPQVDGFEMLRMIKAGQEISSIPVIFYSAVYTGLNDETLALRLGAEAFIVKPKEPEEFWKSVVWVMSNLASGRVAARTHEPLDEELEYLRGYSRMVATKLEEKVRELEETLARRVEAEDSLQQSEAYRRALFESARDAIIIMREGRFVDCNPYTLWLYGVRRDVFIGSVLYEEFSPPQQPDGRLSRESALEKITAAINGVPQLFDWKHRRLDGSLFDAEISLNRVELEGEEVFLQAIVRDVSERKRDRDELNDAYEKLKMTLNDALDTMVKIVEMRDPYTAGHQKRVSMLARAIARELNLPENRLDHLYMAARVHDIGKISIPAEILSKPGKLSSLEFEMVKTHVRSGYDIVENMHFGQEVAEIILQHHEKLDGSGYPRSLVGEDIILEARILCVADFVEAVANHRPYRPALGIDEALEEIAKDAGKLFDPLVVDACGTLFKKKGFRFE